MTTHIGNVNEPATHGPAWPALAAAGIGTALVLTAVGTFWDPNGNDSGSDPAVSEYLIVGGIIVVATALVFRLVVRSATPANASRRALILAVVGLLSLAGFWTGLPAVLAAAALACVMVDRSARGMSRASQAAVAISVVTLGLAVALAISG
jgi:hypothetical protein